MLTLHGDWFVPLVRLVARRELSDDYTHATLPPGHPRRHDMCLNLSHMHDEGDLLTGKDKVFRRAVLVAQIALYAQQARVWETDMLPLLYQIVDEYDIALTVPEGEVWTRRRMNNA